MGGDFPSGHQRDISVPLGEEVAWIGHNDSDKSMWPGPGAGPGHWHGVLQVQVGYVKVPVELWNSTRRPFALQGPEDDSGSLAIFVPYKIIISNH